MRLALTPGQTHDGQAAAELLAELPEGAVVLADKAYDADAIRALIEAQGAAPNIPAVDTSAEEPTYTAPSHSDNNRNNSSASPVESFTPATGNDGSTSNGTAPPATIGK